MTAMYLLGLAVAVATVACRWLPGAGWVYQAPRLGLASWYVALAVVVTSIASAVAVRVVAWPEPWHTGWAWCQQLLAGGSGTAAQAAGWAGAAAFTGLAMWLGWSVTRAAVAARHRLRNQQGMLRLAGRRDAGLQAMVIDDPRPAAFLVPGRGGAVVVTTAAVDRLPPAQLTAVLAHERAHAAGHHHLLVQGARLLAAAFPGVAVFTRAAAQIERLVELRADEVAAAGHDAATLARALVTCAEAPAGAVPAGAVPAAGGDALERVHRLLWPPAVLPRRARAGVAAALSGLATAPVLLVGLIAAFPVLATCLPLT